MSEEEDVGKEGKKEEEEDDEDAGADDGAPSKGKRPPDSIMVQRKSARGSGSSAGSAGKSDSENKSAASMIITIGGLVAFAVVVLGAVGFIVYKVTQIRKDVRRGVQQFLVFAEAPDVANQVEQQTFQNISGGSDNRLDILDNL
ncbi:uncharacterized protein LOC144105002 [Amblyomma americanum]